MTSLSQSLRGLVEVELESRRFPELGLVTEVLARSSESSDDNHQVSVRLRESGAELPHVPVAVGRLGLSALPSVGDLVLVLFVGGELNAPVVVGALYDERTQPPVAEPEQVVYEPGDSSGAERRLHVELPSGVALTANDDGVVVSAGGTEVQIDREGDIVIKASGNVAMESQGDVEIKASGSLSLSGQAVEISGSTVKVEGQAQAELKAGSIGIAGMTQFRAS